MIISMSDILCVTNRSLCKEDFLVRIEKIAKTEAAGIILREKDLSEEEYQALAEKILTICQKQKMQCILHAHTNVARKLAYNAMHLPMPILRTLPEKERDAFQILGASCHSLEEAVWEKAKTYSDKLLTKNNYLMTESEYKAGFNSVDNKEWIWGHAQTNDQSNASYQFHYLDTTTKGSYYYSFNVDPYFRDLFEDGDYRKEMLFWATDPGADVASAAYVWMRNSKFRFRDIENQLGDIVLMRVAEIYLINAEAKAHLNDPDAINKLNDLKTARGAKTIHTNLSQQDLLETIWLERRKELWGEGFSLIDIIRNQQTVVRNAYPEGPIDYIYTDENGQTHTLKKKTQGHRFFNFPDKSAFCPNSKYYLYRITDSEELANKNLYKDHPKLSIYTK